MLWQITRTGRFICQCCALVNPFLVILQVFYARHSLANKIKTGKGWPQQFLVAKFVLN